MDLIDGRGCCAEPSHKLRGELEAEVHPGRADVEENVAGRGHGMARSSVELPEPVELRRLGRAEELVPGRRAKPDYAGQVALQVTVRNRPYQRREVPAECSDGRAVVIARVHRYHQKDCGARQRRDHRLRMRVAQLAFQALHSDVSGHPASGRPSPPSKNLGGRPLTIQNERKTEISDQ